MLSTVFWSWQSDQPARETRALIRDALVAALGRIALDLEEADRPELDHDTRGVPGSPDIVATILAKIEAAGVFVADVTPIAVSAAGKQVANPNVLIELGYAKRALGTERVVLIWNTAFTDAKPEDLPFDLRHRRAPISYALAAGASTAELRVERAALSIKLEAALRSSLGSIPAATPTSLPWRIRDENEPSIWQGGSAALVVSRGYVDGSAQLTMESPPRGYARLLPARWNPKPDAIAILDGETTHPIPLGRYSGLNWGPTKGGFVAYRSSGKIEEEGVTPTATRWFRETGELWGVASSFFSHHPGHQTLNTGYAAERWIAWLQHSSRVARAVGGEGPMHVEIGLDGIEGSKWPTNHWDRGDIQALEDGVRHEFVLNGDSPGEIITAVEQAFVKVAHAYGLSPFTEAEFEALIRVR